MKIFDLLLLSRTVGQPWKLWHQLTCQKMKKVVARTQAVLFYGEYCFPTNIPDSTSHNVAAAKVNTMLRPNVFPCVIWALYAPTIFFRKKSLGHYVTMSKHNDVIALQ